VQDALEGLALAAGEDRDVPGVRAVAAAGDGAVDGVCAAADAAGEGRQVITMSTPATSSPGLFAQAAPASTKGRAIASSRSRTVRSTPFRSSAPASLPPTLPSGVMHA